jgi:hypothetical protein
LPVSNPSSSFSAKQLRVTFTLTNSNAVFVGPNGAAPGNSLQLTGLRMSATIQGGGLPAWPSATVRIYGMLQTDMNALAVQQLTNGKTGYLQNTVLIEANSGNGWSAVFAGNILTAAPNYDAMPDVSFDVTAMTGLFDSVNPATVTSFPGSAGIADILSTIVAKMNRKFINNGVTGVTSGAVYRPESTTEQLRLVCQAYNIDAVFSADDTAVTVTPKGSADTSFNFTLSPTSGLVGYPKALANGMVSIRALFNPAFHVKAPITIANSDVVIDPGVPSTLNSLANGDWLVTSITNTLEALKPDGAWFSDMVLYPPGDTAVTT